MVNLCSLKTHRIPFTGLTLDVIIEKRLNIFGILLNTGGFQFSRGRCGCDCIVVRFITTYAIIARQISETIVHIVVQAPKLTWRLLRDYLFGKSCQPRGIQNGLPYFSRRPPFQVIITVFIIQLVVHDQTKRFLVRNYTYLFYIYLQ